MWLRDTGKLVDKQLRSEACKSINCEIKKLKPTFLHYWVCRIGLVKAKVQQLKSHKFSIHQLIYSSISHNFKYLYWQKFFSCFTSKSATLYLLRIITQFWIMATFQRKETMANYLKNHVKKTTGPSLGSCQESWLEGIGEKNLMLSEFGCLLADISLANQVILLVLIGRWICSDFIYQGLSCRYWQQWWVVVYC